MQISLQKGLVVTLHTASSFQLPQDLLQLQSPQAQAMASLGTAHIK